jgi:hypothetical protein
MVSPGQKEMKNSTQSNQIVSACDNLLVAFVTHRFKSSNFVFSFSFQDVNSPSSLSSQGGYSPGLHLIL